MLQAMDATASRAQSRLTSLDEQSSSAEVPLDASPRRGDFVHISEAVSRYLDELSETAAAERYDAQLAAPEVLAA
jgi:hypothetical protein